MKAQFKILRNNVTGLYLLSILDSLVPLCKRK